jgi:hypothetical protein
MTMAMTRRRRVARAIRARCAQAACPPDAERGDVPGWVMVTIMTAGLVLGIWAVAGDLLADVFRDAINGVVSGVGG